MKKIQLLCVALLSCSMLFAGNPDRNGQAGAYELLINPYARSSGWNGLNTSNCKGFEATRLNIAGMAHTKKTELVFAKCIPFRLQGSTLSMNTLGFTQKLGESSVIGIGLVAMNFGEINITTTESPEGGIGVYKPQFFNLSLSYAKAFSNSIFGGVTLNAISEAIPNAKAQGFSMDAGIQYLTGPKENIHFGISLRNIGTPMRYSGDGMSFSITGVNQTTFSSYPMTVEQRAEKFELPSLLNIGGAYDFHFKEDLHRLTFAANFTSNSFSKDQIGVGAEYAFREMFMFRAGYLMERGQMSSTAVKTNAHSGLAAGITFEVPIKKEGPAVAVDYSYRSTNPFRGTHTIGLRLTL